MKKIILLIALISALNFSQAQNYDLIVTVDKDSIACQIDSITDSHIYFEMRHNYNWVHTFFKKEQLSEYKKDAVDMKHFDFKDGSSYIISRKKKFVGGYQHAHRLMFAPTSYALKKNDAYFTTHFAMLYSIQYGFSNQISFDIGTTYLAIPWYGMLNASFPLSESFALTAGNLTVFDIWADAGIIGNITYVLASFGKPEKNLNAGIGFLYLPDNLIIKTNTAAYTISGNIKIGKRAYFMTEHYIAQVNNRFTDHYELPSSNPDLDPLYQNYRYSYKTLFIGGLTGIRLTGKKNPCIGWQFGLADFILIHDTHVPEEYRHLENHMDENDVLVIPFPMISFSYKFGKNYK